MDKITAINCRPHNCVILLKYNQSHNFMTIMSYMVKKSRHFEYD